MGYSMFCHPETFRNPRSPATVALDILTDCHPLATTICVRPGSPFATLRGSRTRRKDKSRSLRKQYSARCASSSPSPVSRTSLPFPADDMCNFPSTPSEYAAYKAALNATYTTTTPSSTPPIHVPFRSIPAQTITSVVNIIPTLSLNLGLGRAMSSSSLSSHSSASPHPHHHSLSSTTRTSKHRRLSKSVIAEAQWWIKMYESLAWHIKQVEERQQQSPFSHHELAFLERLEAQVQSEWYPIVEKARTMARRDALSGCRIISPEELHPGSAFQPSGLHDKWRLSCQELTSSDSAAMLGPTQLAAQAFLRRSQASGKPMRRKRHISPGCSALRCEITA